MSWARPERGGWGLSKPDDFGIGQERELDLVIKFIVKGSPADSKSLVKMPPQGGHLDLTDSEIREIAGLVIGLAQGYVEKKPSKVVSQKGFLPIGTVLSYQLESRLPPSPRGLPVKVLLPGPRRFMPGRRRLLRMSQNPEAKEWQGLSLEELSRLQSEDLSKPSDKVEGTSGNSPKKRFPSVPSMTTAILSTSTLMERGGIGHIHRKRGDLRS